MAPVAGCPAILNRPQLDRATHTFGPSQDTTQLLVSVSGAQDVVEPTAKATKNVTPIFYNLWQGVMMEYGLVVLPAIILDDPIWHPRSPIKLGDTTS